jgi:hypothetical protein
MRHLNVQQHYIRSVLANRLHRFRSIGACRYDVGFRLRLEQANQALPPDRLIVGNQNSQRHLTNSSRSFLVVGIGVWAAS